MLPFGGEDEAGLAQGGGPGARHLIRPNKGGRVIDEGLKQKPRQRPSPYPT